MFSAVVHWALHDLAKMIGRAQKRIVVYNIAEMDPPPEQLKSDFNDLFSLFSWPVLPEVVFNLWSSELKKFFR